MSYAEFLRWIKYRNKWGPLHPGLRIDRAGAVMATSMSGGKMENFMPWPRDPQNAEDIEELPVATPDQIAMAFGAQVSYTGKRKRAAQEGYKLVSAADIKSQSKKKQREAIKKTLLEKRHGK